jgi:effector-binding domain-containing protein
MSNPSRIYTIELLNGQRIEVTYLVAGEVQARFNSETWTVHEKLSEACTIYGNKQGQVLENCFVDKAGLLFKSVADYQAQKGKVVLIRREDNQELIIFNLLDEKELQSVLRKNKLKKIKELSKKNNIDIFNLPDGKILKADVYGTYGELYKDIDEYNYMREHWEKDIMLVVPGIIKR